MLNYNTDKKEFKLTFKNPFMLVFSLIAGIMFISGIKEFLKSPPELLSEGSIFIFLWSSVALFIIYTSLNYFFRKLIINEKGVILKNIIGSKKLTWQEISDYGIAQNSNMRDGGTHYILYFSNENSVPKNNEKRKFYGKTIKFPILMSNTENIKYSVLPFCKKYIDLDSNQHTNNLK